MNILIFTKKDDNYKDKMNSIKEKIGSEGEQQPGEVVYVQ
jgi:hypothetical protein